MLAQFGAEPPFGGSSSLSNVFFNTPFVGQNAVHSPNPFNGIHDATRGQPVDLSIFRPIFFYGDFQPHLRVAVHGAIQLDHSASSGQRHDVSDGLCGIAGPSFAGRPRYQSLESADLSGHQFASLRQREHMRIADRRRRAVLRPGDGVAPTGGFHVPYGPNGPAVIPAGATSGRLRRPDLNLVGSASVFLAQLQPVHRRWLPNRRRSCFHRHLRRRHNRQLQLQRAGGDAGKALLARLAIPGGLHLEQVLDDASTSRRHWIRLTTMPAARLSLFNSAQRFVISYDWELPLPKHQGLAGKVLDDWAISGITQFQSGFPIRLDTTDDNELINSFFFTRDRGAESGGAVPEAESENQRQLLVQPERLCRIRRWASLTMERSAPSAAGQACRIGISPCTRRFRSRETQICAVPGRIFQHLQPHEFRQSGRTLLGWPDRFGKYHRPATSAKCNLL